MSGNDDGLLMRILGAFAESAGPLTLRRLSRMLEVDESALTPMLRFLVRKGRLREIRSETCGVCPSSGSCPLAGVELPTRYVLPESDAQCPD